MILFRVDANEHIATGHMMRCITIASKLIEMGEEVLFCLAENEFTCKLVENGIKYIVLDTKWNDMESEIDIMKEVIQKYSASWVIVDSYQATKKYLESLQCFVDVLYYDDMCIEPYNIATVLHPYDWGAKEYIEKYVGLNTKILVGLKFLPLRKEFYPNENDIDTKRILITTGGMDTYNVAGKVVRQAVVCQELQNYNFDIIVGKMNEYKIELQAIEDKYHDRVKLYYDVNNMGDMMRNSSCIVTAGGTTAYEICACAMPSICFSFADNQYEFVQNLGKYEIMLSAGDAREGIENTVEKILDNLKKIISDKVLREKLKDNMSRLVDTKGTTRICEYLLSENM